MCQVWERRRRIPSQTYNDPLDHIFTEFDSDGDGHLTAEEIASALQSRGVKATPDLVQEFINGKTAVLLSCMLRIEQRVTLHRRSRTCMNG